MEHAVSGRKYLPGFLKNIYIFFTRLFLKGLDSSNNIDSRINITTFFNFPDMFRRYIRLLRLFL